MKLSGRLYVVPRQRRPFLPDFSPYAFEFEIPASNAVEYADTISWEKSTVSTSTRGAGRRDRL